MAIWMGVMLYLLAVVCLCAIVGASRVKQERCIRANKAGLYRRPTEFGAAELEEHLVGGIAVREAGRS